MSDNGQLVKMKIIGYQDKEFTNLTDSMAVQVNPSSLKYAKGISYAAGGGIGTQADAAVFNKAEPTSLNFDFLFDQTGVLPPTTDLKGATIEETVNLFEKIAYQINGESHEPNFLVVSWGSFVFKGRLKSAQYDYSLFRPDGSPLRVKITVSIQGYMDPLTERKVVGRRSPDLTRVVTLSASDSLPLLCLKFYGDPTYCTDIARINNLKGFRSIKPGTKLLFPPLQRNG